MVHLIFSILSTTSILIIFKTIEKLKIDVFQVIIINYAIAFSLGLFLTFGELKWGSLNRVPLNWGTLNPVKALGMILALGALVCFPLHQLLYSSMPELMCN
jgi:hypothetical protein